MKRDSIRVKVLGRGGEGLWRGGETFLQKGFPAPPNLLFYTNPLRAGDELGYDGYGDFLGCFGTDFEADGAVDAPKSSSEKPSEHRKL